MDVRKGFPGSFATSRDVSCAANEMGEGEPNRDSDYRIVYQIYSLLCELQAIRTRRHESRIPKETSTDSYARGRQ
jgi:hypothetical protein